MTFSIQALFLFAFLYLLLLFAVAFACEKGLLSKRLTRHPLTYVLSLCIYTSAWTFYACISYAWRDGFNFLTFFLGVSGVFLLAPIFLLPILRLTRNHQLASIADLYAFRYRSRRVGVITTLLLLLGMLPLMSLQLQAVGTSIDILTHTSSDKSATFWFCLLVLVFTLLFGAKHLSNRQKNEGLVAAIAFESLIKIVAFAGVAIAGFFGVFHGIGGFSEWLSSHPDIINRMYSPLQDGNWQTLIVAFFVAVVIMPHIFHMTFTENLNPNTLVTASWALPFFMLIIALCVPFILWEALAGHAPTQPDYHLLGVGLITHPWVVLLGYLAGLASATGMLIVSTLALASMCLNHLVLPWAAPRPMDDLYARLLWLKRLLIAIILLATYAYYAFTPPTNLMTLGSLSFVAALQFVPGLIGLLLWPGANRNGFLAGVLAGFSIWAITLLAPALGVSSYDNQLVHILHLARANNLQQHYNIGAASLVINALTMIIVSLVTRTSPAEKQAAETCVLDSSNRSQRWILEATTIDDFEKALAMSLGPATAKHELSLALDDLSLDPTETRPYALRRLRDQLESNLSGLLGPSVASRLIDSFLPYRHNQDEQSEDTQLIESRIEMYRDQLSGLAAELDSLRRFHRQTLLELPIGVISLSDDDEIIGWNRTMEALTHITADTAIGARLDALPGPWAEALHGFVLKNEDHDPRCPLEETQRLRWLSLHKSRIQSTSANVPNDSLVIVVEDITEHSAMEARLAHNERLASIGRLAAGVAHEIGNPVTAIASLAQNLKASDDSFDPQEFTEEMAQIIAQTNRISRIVESLVTFSHSGKQHVNADSLPVSIYDTAEEAIHLLQLNPHYRNHQFDNQISANETVTGDSQRLLQVFVNLLNNAADASNVTDTISLSSYHGGDFTFIDIEDHGSGISPDIMDHLFEPFVSSKAPGRGTGLGLALIYSIMEEHNGDISVTSPVNDGRGTRFTLRLPTMTPKTEH